MTSVTVDKIRLYRENVEIVTTYQKENCVFFNHKGNPDLIEIITKIIQIVKMITKKIYQQQRENFLNKRKIMQKIVTKTN